ncbi:hypothetical protein [Burkholderia gladioli]|uniref:hypothetical protein n=1 Tax=Burkholderia gladioli TaxID=28095 RepID=UPI001640E5C1|nr:hypothetical protein [Burkholderia gladioli]
MKDEGTSFTDATSSHATYLSGLLDKIIEEPTKYNTNEELRAALRSQGAFSRYSTATRHGVSLNTLKAQANIDVIGGFPDLDKRRQQALRLVEASLVETEKKDYRSKVAVTNRNRELQQDIIRLYCDMWQLTSAFGRALDYYVECANESGNPETIQLCKKHIRQLHEVVSPAQLQKVEQELRRRLRLELISQ